MRPSKYLVAIAGAALAVAACAQQGGSPTFNPSSTSYNDVHRDAKKHHRSGSNPITHVFVIVQENRTVDNLFNGFPGANTQNYGNYQGQQVMLQPTPIATDADYPHTLQAFNSDTGCPVVPNSLPCPMNGFTPPHGNDPGAYSYVPQQYTGPYWSMAEQYAFGDEMFQSNLDGSYVSHQYLVAAQAHNAVNFPYNPDGTCGNSSGNYVDTITSLRGIGLTESPCMNYKTIGKELYDAGLPWRYYDATAKSGLTWWEPFLWISNQNQNWPGGTVESPPNTFISDIQSPSGYNANVTWITPTVKNSDHSGAGYTSNHGPDWVAAVVNAIGTSQYWDNSVIFITWDDWGGWYDHASPAYVSFDSVGVRVPFIIISPYTKQGLVTHTHYEQASILKYIENHFGLANLSDADTRANDPEPDVMSNLGPTPRPFTKIVANPYYTADDPGPPDDE